jgi:RNA polymerase sigma-70 factor, ECF subfamily
LYGPTPRRATKTFARRAASPPRIGSARCAGACRGARGEQGNVQTLFAGLESHYNAHPHKRAPDIPSAPASSRLIGSPRPRRARTTMVKKESRTTQQLVLRIHGGDREAFDLLFMRYYPRIKLLVRLQMLDKLRAQVEADDIIQEIYLEVYKNFHKFEYSDPDSFFKWISKVIGWKIKDFDKYFFKTAKRQPQETVSLQQRVGESDTSSMEYGDGIAARQATPSQIIIEREGYQMLYKAMEKLPENFQTVVMYRHVMKLSAAETAERMGMQPNAVNVLYHRAQQRLHDILREMSYFA